MQIYVAHLARKCVMRLTDLCQAASPAGNSCRRRRSSSEASDLLSSCHVTSLVSLHDHNWTSSL